MTTIVLVGLGGFIGTILRFLSYQIKFTHLLPFSTLLINLLGSFLLGIVMSSPITKHDNFYQFIAIGVLGGFTTYSAFSGETLNLLMKNEFLTAITYVLTSVLGGLLFCTFGFLLSKCFWD